ncbi:hypothetical protein [Methylobacterium sp. E-065]|uniref:hypothetical protein n=1 Tax=Methylobacterium sp. E-065 TaxID=2836583 RepID=UPI001FB89D07|nr:hypothetical protein [Methylobacterium sp. E-065]
MSLLRGPDRLGFARGLNSREGGCFLRGGCPGLPKSCALFLQGLAVGLERVDPCALAGEGIQLLQSRRAGGPKLFEVFAAGAEAPQRLGISLGLGLQPVIFKLEGERTGNVAHVTVRPCSSR